MYQIEEIDELLISQINNKVIKLDKFPLNLHDFVTWTRNTKLVQPKYEGIIIKIKNLVTIKFVGNAEININGYIIAQNTNNNILYDVYWLS